MTGKLVTTNSDYFYSLSEKGPGMVVSEDEFIGAIKTNDNIIAVHLMADPDDMDQIDKAGTLASAVIQLSVLNETQLPNISSSYFLTQISLELSGYSLKFI